MRATSPTTLIYFVTYAIIMTDRIDYYLGYLPIRVRIMHVLQNKEVPSRRTTQCGREVLMQV